MKNCCTKKLISITLTIIAVMACSDQQRKLTIHDDKFYGTEGFNAADSLVSDIGDSRDFQRVIDAVDSLKAKGELSLVKTIFYKTISYNILGQQSASLLLYHKLEKIDPKELTTQADLSSYVYSYNNYIRMLCDMRRYDRALREAYNADRKLKEAGFSGYADHHDIAQIIGESLLYMGQTTEADKSFQKALKGMHVRLKTNNDPVDLRECQKTMNAIARAYMRTGHYKQAIPWMAVQDSLLTVADKHLKRDSMFVDEMSAEICYSKALLAHALGQKDKAEREFNKYLATNTAKQLANSITNNEYLIETHRYQEAAKNFEQLDQFLKAGGYKTDLENLGQYMLPKLRANLMAGRRDTALAVASAVTEYYDSALTRQKMINADLLTTIYDTEGKERQIAEQRAELMQQRLIAFAIIVLIVFAFFYYDTMQRRKAYRILNESNRQLIKANERAEESSRMKSKFIHQISHEVRTPLNVLSGFSQVLTNPHIELSSEEMQSISRKIVDSSERITHLIDKMLDLSQINSNADVECRDTVSPAELAEKAVSQSGIQEAEHLEMKMLVTPPCDSLNIVTNRKAAVKALALLLDNAMKFTHPLAYKGQRTDHTKAHVTLTVRTGENHTDSQARQDGSPLQQDGGNKNWTPGRMVLFVVEDTGIGIPPEQAENIFTEFVQLDEYSDGTGIGLSIARSLARHMGGDIWLDTSYTNGARFVMSLPMR